MAGGWASAAESPAIRIKLPSYLGFFAGKRFVPIITCIVAIFLGLILTFVWTPVQAGINALGDWAVSQNTPVGVWIYGTVERALLPFGLHHIWNAFWFFEIGSFTTPGQRRISRIPSLPPHPRPWHPSRWQPDCGIPPPQRRRAA